MGFHAVQGLQHREDQRVLDVPERPKDFNIGLAVPNHLSYRALEESTEIRERLGRPARNHRLELYHRHTGPISVIVLLLLAGAIALR